MKRDAYRKMVHEMFKTDTSFCLFMSGLRDRISETVEIRGDVPLNEIPTEYIQSRLVESKEPIGVLRGGPNNSVVVRLFEENLRNNWVELSSAETGLFLECQKVETVNEYLPALFETMAQSDWSQSPSIPYWVEGYMSENNLTLGDVFLEMSKYVSYRPKRIAAHQKYISAAAKFNKKHNHESRVRWDYRVWTISRVEFNEDALDGYHLSHIPKVGTRCPITGTTVTVEKTEEYVHKVWLAKSVNKTRTLRRTLTWITESRF